MKRTNLFTIFLFALCCLVAASRSQAGDDRWLKVFRDADKTLRDGRSKSAPSIGEFDKLLSQDAKSIISQDPKTEFLSGYKEQTVSNTLTIKSADIGMDIVARHLDEKGERIFLAAPTDIVHSIRCARGQLYQLMQTKTFAENPTWLKKLKAVLLDMLEVDSISPVLYGQDSSWEKYMANLGSAPRDYNPWSPMFWEMSNKLDDRLGISVRVLVIKDKPDMCWTTPPSQIEAALKQLEAAVN